LNSSRILDRRVLEAALDALGLSLDAAEMLGSGLDQLQLRARRCQFRDGLLQVADDNYLDRSTTIILSG
jgi:hypothetical protein